MSKRKALLTGLLTLAMTAMGALTARAQSTVTVTGSFKTATAANVSGAAGVNYLKIRLRNFSGNLPRYTSTGVITQTEVDVVPDSSGDVSTSIYGNDDLSPDGTYYSFDFYVGGRLRTTTNFAICRAVAENGCSGFSSAFDFNSATALSTVAVVAPGDGDSTYWRLDGGNQPSGALQPSSNGTNFGAVFGAGNRWTVNAVTAVVDGMTTAQGFRNGTIGSIASASTISVDNAKDTFELTGTTTVTTINTCSQTWGGRVIRIITTGSVQISDGSNLKLNANFSGTADDVLTLVCDGVDSTWHEIARSAN